MNALSGQDFKVVVVLSYRVVLFKVVNFYDDMMSQVFI